MGIAAIVRSHRDRGTDLSPNNLNFSDLKPTSSSQLLVYLFLASAYEF